MTVRRLLCAVLFLALLAVLGGGCDSSFEPYAETERAFSLFGILDAGSNRHPVRVEPLQDGRPFTADSVIDAAATITNTATGREVVLKHQRRRRGEGFQHEFVAHLEPQLATTYRLVVRRSDGNASTATLTMPNTIPKLSLVARDEDQDGTKELYAVVERAAQDRLLFLTVSYHVRLNLQPGPDDPPPPSFERTFTAEYGTRISPTETGYADSLDWRTDLRAAYSSPQDRPATATLMSVEARVGMVHPSAPDYGELSYEEIFTVGVAPSNVENGYGYVAGTTSDMASLPIEGNIILPRIAL